MRNNGVVVGGESIEECFQLSRNVMNAIDTQVNHSFFISPVFCNFNWFKTLLVIQSKLNNVLFETVSNSF